MLFSTLGKGAFSIVAKAYDNINKQFVAVKKILKVNIDSELNIFYKTFRYLLNLLKP